MTSPEQAIHSARKRLTLLAGVLFLSACGQTGPLYLPQDTPEQQNTGEQEPPAAHQDHN